MKNQMNLNKVSTNSPHINESLFGCLNRAISRMSYDNEVSIEKR